MKKAVLATLIVVAIGLSGFKDPVVYEQEAFNLFIFDILTTEFKDIGTIEFKGETEHTYSALGKYKICLNPAEKLQSLLEDAAKAKRKDSRQISYNKVKNVAIAEFKQNSANPKLYVYPAVHLADNYYVFVSFQKPNEAAARYVFELKPDGKVSRSCRME